MKKQKVAKPKAAKAKPKANATEAVATETVAPDAIAPEAVAEAAASPAKPKRRKATPPSDGTTLVIVESPTKAKTISKYLGRGYTVKATVGHLRDLPQRKLGVDLENGFTPEYVTIKEKEKTLKEIKQAAKSVAHILIATDPDREGEAIGWHVADQLPHQERIRRVLFHEITKDAVAEAIAHPLEIDQRKVDAQQARRILDRLVGYKASPVLWKSIKTGLSAGRVQTVALRLICEREDEIRAFKPQEYWTIEADLEKDGQGFQARLHKLDGQKPEIADGETARKIAEEAAQLPFKVTSAKIGQRRKSAPAPFTTSTLQQEAAKQLGFSAKRTMRAAQQLYEGIEIGDEGQVGLITYMRTDSVRVADSALTALREFIGANYAPKYLPETATVHKSGKGGSRVQDAHEAVRPTEVTRRPEPLKGQLESDTFKLYTLIWRRFVASQMAPSEYETTTVDFDLGRFLFRATGSRVLFDGFQVLYHEGREKEEGQDPDELAAIPQLAEGDVVAVKAVTPSQHFTEPPPRFSQASLVKALEEKGIGRPSTYASIISTLQARWYATTKERRFSPTPLGEKVWKVMLRCFPETFEVGFTAQMEGELDKVEEGDLPWRDVVGDLWSPFARQLDAIDIDKLIRAVHDLSSLATDKCPNCGGPLEVRSGRFGPYIACLKYPECKFSKPIGKDKIPDKPSDEICKECGAPMVIKTGRFGEFLACTRYPKCTYTRPVPLGIKCPKCTIGDIAERRTGRGRSFFGCLRYPDCDFSVWNRPVPVPCPSCGFVGMEEKRTKTMGATRKCLKCGHEMMLEEVQAAEPVAS